MISWNLVEAPSSTDDAAAVRRSEEQVRRRAVRKAQQMQAQQNAMAARTLSTDLRQDLLRRAMDVQEAEHAAASKPTSKPTPMPTPRPALPPAAALRESARPADDATEQATISESATAAAAAESSEATDATAMQQQTEALSQALADTRRALASIDSARSLDLDAASREIQDSSWHERAEASLDFIEAFHAEALSDPEEKSRLLATLADARTVLQKKMLTNAADGELSALLASSTWVQQLAIESRRAGDSLPVLTLRAV